MATDLLAIDMNFGKDDAESDERLKDWFLETSDFKNVMQLEYSLILGQKGSGKSAILRMLHERAENDTVIIDESVGKVDFLRYFNQIQDFNMVVHNDLLIKFSSDVSVLALIRQSHINTLLVQKVLSEKEWI